MISERILKIPSMSDVVLRTLSLVRRSPLCKIGLVDRIVSKASGNPREVVRFVKFGMVGAIGALVDFAALNLLVLAFAMPLAAASTISFILAVISNFTWNRLWSFPESRQRSIWIQLPQFALVNVIGLGINLLVLLSLNQYVFTPLFGRLGYNLAKAVAILVVWFWNYGMNRAWTYRGL